MGRNYSLNSLQAAFKAWTNIIARWPKDLVRPENVSFQTLMRRRLDHHTGQAISKAPGKESGSASRHSQPNLMARSHGGETNTGAGFAARESIREQVSNASTHSATRKAILPITTTWFSEMHEAPNRSWFGGVVKRYQGFLEINLKAYEDMGIIWVEMSLVLGILGSFYDAGGLRLGGPVLGKHYQEFAGLYLVGLMCFMA